MAESTCSYCEALTAWSTFALALLTLAVVGAAFIARKQLREAAIVRQLESTLPILRYLDNENFGRTRWFLYEHKEELQAFLHPHKPFTWVVKQNWDATFEALNKDQTCKIDFYSVRSLIHALDNIAFLIDRGYVSYDKIMPGMMENHFRIADSLLSDYIRYSLKMEAGGALFPVPPRYTPSFGVNFLRLMDKIKGAR